MDQLKQVLKFQFWILLGIALILPLVGWTMATSGLLSEAEGRTKALVDLDKSLVTDSNDPNKDWESGLEAINVEQAKQPKKAAKELYERQLPLMTWPPKMPNDPTKFQTNHQEYYRTAYRQFVEEVRKIVKPYDEETQTGQVIYSPDLLPSPDSEWASQSPSVKQIEGAQEDLWLLSALLKQIASVNEDAATPFEAAIRQINELYLKGGSKAGAGGGAKSSSGGAGSSTMASGMKTGMESKMAGMALATTMAGASGMGGQGAGGGSNSITSAKINPDEDLGAEQAVASDKPADTKTSSASSAGSKDLRGGGGMERMMMPLMVGGGGGSSAGSASRWSGSNMGRYREDKPEYRTRGFYLEVVMDHRRIPDLLAALVNADWPINILRVQESDFKDEDLAEGGGGLSGMGGRMSSQMMPGMGGGAGMRGGLGGPPPGMRGGGGSFKAATSRLVDDSNDSPVNSRSAMDLNNRSALDDPNLANVSIVGVIYIFKKPPEEKSGATPPASPAPSATPSAATAPVAPAPATAAPGATADDPSKSAPAATEAAADDDKAAEQAVPAAVTPEIKPESKSEDEGVEHE